MLICSTKIKCPPYCWSRFLEHKIEKLIIIYILYNIFWRTKHKNNIRNTTNFTTISRTNLLPTHKISNSNIYLLYCLNHDTNYILVILVYKLFLRKLVIFLTFSRQNKILSTHLMKYLLASVFVFAEDSFQFIIEYLLLLKPYPKALVNDSIYFFFPLTSRAFKISSNL